MITRNVVQENNWEDYLGWSKFEVENVLPKYLRAIRCNLDEEQKVVSVGCGQGFPDSLLLDQCRGLLGIDSNSQLLEQARKSGLNTQLLDAYEIRNQSELREIADIVIAPFFVHNTPNERMNELFANFNYLLREEGTLVLLDPNANNEHKQATDRRTFRRVLALEGDEYLDPNSIDPDIDQYRIEIHLNAGLLNETVIIHQHKSHRQYLSALEQNGFGSLKHCPVGYQTSVDGGNFAAYQLWTAVKETLK